MSEIWDQAKIFSPQLGVCPALGSGVMEGDDEVADSHTDHLHQDPPQLDHTEVPTHLHS